MLQSTLLKACGVVTSRDLQNIHKELCHQGITRMTHVVRSRNLKELRTPVGYAQKTNQGSKKNLQQLLIKATQCFERLNLDFKGPLPSKTKNKYRLTIIDEYSRFLFTISRLDIPAKTVVQGLCSLSPHFWSAHIHPLRSWVCFYVERTQAIFAWTMSGCKSNNSLQSSRQWAMRKIQ